MSTDSYGKLILEVKNLKILNSSNRLMLENISFSLNTNKSIGIIGNNGSGKSTIFSSIVGINKNINIINGSILINDIDVTHFNEKEWEKSKLRKNFISQVFQNPSNSFNPNKKIIQQFQDMYKIHHQITNKTIVTQKAYKQLKKFKIDEPYKVLDKYPFQLSNGTIQKIVIALILITNAKIILFDEPIANMDLISKKQIVEIILFLKKKTNKSFIVISHDIDFLSKVCDDLIILKEGRIVEKGTKDEIIYNPKHPYSWDLLKYNPYFSSRSNLDYSKPFYEKIYSLNLDRFLFPPEVKLNPSHSVYSWLYTNKFSFQEPKEIKKIFKKQN